jgi:hypothetical protein
MAIATLLLEAQSISRVAARRRGRACETPPRVCGPVGSPENSHALDGEAAIGSTRFKGTRNVHQP